MVEKEEISSTNKVIGFVVTLILLPVLFAGGCIPVALLNEGNFGKMVGAIQVYSILFFGFAILVASYIKNPGVKLCVIWISIFGLLSALLLSIL